MSVSSSNSQGRTKNTLKRKCKSLFKEINQRYSQIESQESDKNMNKNIGSFDLIETFSNDSSNNRLFGHNSHKIQQKELNSIPKNNFYITVQPVDNYVKYKKYINSDFCAILENQLLDPEFDEQEIFESKKRINEKIYLINDILRGRVMKCPNHVKLNEFVDLDQDPLDTNYNLCPQSEWVFNTPTRQRVCKPKLKKHSALPAILYRNNLNQTTGIFELKPEDITIDLTKFEPENSQPCNEPFFAKPLGFFDKPMRNMEAKQTCLFPPVESNGFIQNFELNLSQQFNGSNSNLFNFQPSFTSGNLFNF